MDDLPPLDSPTLQAHKRQRFWQILLPVSLAAVLFLAAGGLVIGAEAGEARQWADAAVIWLVAPLLVFALFALAVLVGLIYALARLAKVAPRYTRQAQDFAERLAAGVKRGADAAAGPVLWLEQARAAVKALFD
jgi:type II secretory pathway component PulL